ncbi:MAG: hypothetical protein ACI90G_001232, partial [Urechidicola sp.]
QRSAACCQWEHNSVHKLDRVPFSTLHQNLCDLFMLQKIAT